MSPYQAADILREYAGFIPGAAVTLMASLIAGRHAGQLMRVRPALGRALVLSIGVVLSATVTPSHDALAHGIPGSGICDLARVGLPSWDELLSSSEPVLNILLFLPLGAAIGLCPPSRARLMLVVLAYTLPFAIETIQLVALPLGRECQSADVVDNLTGLTLGIVAATAVRAMLSMRRGANAIDIGEAT